MNDKAIEAKGRPATPIETVEMAILVSMAKGDDSEGMARAAIQAYLAALPAPADAGLMGDMEKYAARIKTSWANVLELNLIPEVHRLTAQILEQESSEMVTRIRSAKGE